MRRVAKRLRLWYNNQVKVRIKSYAKLNLTLDLKGKEGGFHLLDSLVCSIDLYDKIVAVKRKDKKVNVVFKYATNGAINVDIDGKANAERAGRAFVEQFGTLGADITVYRNIPCGAGLGSSSADAAGVINAMAKLYSVKDGAACKQIADSLGSDTGFMMRGGFARMRGRGERVEWLSGMPKLHFLLILPYGGVSTAACFDESDLIDREESFRTQAAVELLQKGMVDEFATWVGNDLESAAARLNADVPRAVAEAKSFSPLAQGMTGSGSAVFALFETPELCEWAQSRYTGRFHTMVVHSVQPQEKNMAWYTPFALSEEERSLIGS